MYPLYKRPVQAVGCKNMVRCFFWPEVAKGILDQGVSCVCIYSYVCFYRATSYASAVLGVVVSEHCELRIIPNCFKCR